MSFVMALDQGTTSSRAIIFDRSGAIVAAAQNEFTQHFPRPGWVEHDPGEIWTSQIEVAEVALARAGANSSEIAAIGIANQRETTILWDRDSGQPICNAIVWQDRRTAPMCDRLRADGLETTIRERTGLVLDAYFSGTKLAWMLDNIEDARVRAERGELAFGTVDCWLVNRLTDGALHVTDVSNASRTLLFNIHDRKWDDELLEIFGVPRAMLPEVRPSLLEGGEEASKSPLAGVPIGGIVGDQQAALMGQVCTEPGMAKNTYGTGCFLLVNTGPDPRPSENRLLTTVAWEREETVTYALEGSVFIGGAVVQWLRDGLKLIRESSDVEALAETVPDSGGVYLVPAFAGLGAPHWDPYARGAIIGITRGTEAGHIARAALEGIAFQVADLADAMQHDSGSNFPELRVDGGAASNDLLMQFQADILGTPVVRPTVLDTTALGAAYMAGLAVGYWSSVEEIRANWVVDRSFEPMMPHQDVERIRGRWNDALDRAKAWAGAEDE